MGLSIISFNIPSFILLANTFICSLIFLLKNTYTYRKVDKTNVSSMNYRKADISVTSNQVKEENIANLPEACLPFAPHFFPNSKYYYFIL